VGAIDRAGGVVIDIEHEYLGALFIDGLAEVDTSQFLEV
jgi:hypothetical protein